MSTLWGNDNSRPTFRIQSSVPLKPRVESPCVIFDMARSILQIDRYKAMPLIGEEGPDGKSVLCGILRGVAACRFISS
jgi:hypothetical protein